jgi:putative ABC transport system substrate-binding protein
MASLTIGFLGACNRTMMWGDWLDAFKQQLATHGWTDGKVTIECEWAEGLKANYTKYAKQFADQKVNVIVTGGTQATMACKKAAAKVNPPIPVVFATAGDPIDTNLVKSFSQPGNLTGVSNQQINLVIKRLDTLRLFNNRKVGLVGNDDSPNVELEMEVARLVAPTLGLKISKHSIRRQKDIAPIIRKLRGKVDALLVCTDPLITTHADELNAEAMDAKLITMHAFREYLKHGGALSCGPKFVELFQKAADKVDIILRGQAGQNMANVPVEQSNDFEYLINHGPFRKMGRSLPPRSVLANAGIVPF